MTEAALERVCGNCGATAREGTSFCYACGTDVTAAVEKSEDAGEQVVHETLEPDESDEPAVERIRRRANAAAERRASRLGKRKPKKIVWEEPPERLNQMFVLITVVIFVAAMVVVGLTVLVK
jgi:uncharacterized membrane protein YvbJ